MTDGEKALSEFGYIRDETIYTPEGYELDYGFAYMRAFNRMLNHRKEKSLQMTWQTADEVMDWWLRQ